MGKKLSAEDWNKPDPVMSIFYQRSLMDGTISQMTDVDWVNAILQYKLVDTVPVEVRDLYDTVQHTFAQGYNKYQLYTSAMQEMLKVADAAVKHKCDQLNASAKKKTFAQRLALLASAGVLSLQQQAHWYVIRQTRNYYMHPERRETILPGMALRTISNIVEAINTLFQQTT